MIFPSFSLLVSPNNSKSPVERKGRPSCSQELFLFGGIQHPHATSPLAALLTAPQIQFGPSSSAALFFLAKIFRSHNSQKFFFFPTLLSRNQKTGYDELRLQIEREKKMNTTMKTKRHNHAPFSARERIASNEVVVTVGSNRKNPGASAQMQWLWKSVSSAKRTLWQVGDAIHALLAEVSRPRDVEIFDAVD